MKKVLVTGGVGYIGSHTVVELISAGYTPVIVDNFSNSESWILERIAQISGVNPAFYEGDCTDKAFLNEVFLQEPEIDSVIHFAAMKSALESIEKPIKYYKNNVGGIVTLLETMNERGVTKLVFSSSATVYGESGCNPIPETAEVKNQTSPYGTTKVMCEKIIEDVVQSSTLKAISLRYFNPIGAHSSTLIGELPIGIPNNLIPYLTQTAAGLRDSLTIFGDDYPTEDGTCIRDFIHVVDLAKAHVAALKHLENAIANTHSKYNVGTGAGESVLGLIKLFESATGVDLPYKIGPRRAGDIVECFADVTKIKSELGWQAELSTKEALLDSWNWQKSLSETLNP